MSASCEQGITLAGDLHARPAGALAVAAGRFASAVSVTAGGQTANAKSVLGVMGLGATSGQHVTVSAAGPDAQEAVAALITILGEATKVGGLPDVSVHRGGDPGSCSPLPPSSPAMAGATSVISSHRVGALLQLFRTREARAPWLAPGKIIFFCVTP